MIELTTDAEDASEASERVEQLLNEHLPSRGRLEPGVGCSEPLRFSPDVPTELQSLRDKVELLAEDYRLLSTPYGWKTRGAPPTTSVRISATASRSAGSCWTSSTTR
jgi:hypothetical protein